MSSFSVNWPNVVTVTRMGLVFVVVMLAYGQTTFDQVIADHWQDRFLLQKAALPIVINPADSMRKFAHAEGWTVLCDRGGTLSAEKIVQPILELAKSN